MPKKSKSTKSKKSGLMKAKKPDFVMTNFSQIDFLILKAKKVFIYLWKAFTRALILCYLNLKYYICIETDASGYAINEILSQMTLSQSSFDHMTYKYLNLILSFELDNNVGQWHPIVFFPRKMIYIKIRYKTHDQQLPALLGLSRLGTSI